MCSNQLFTRSYAQGTHMTSKLKAPRFHQNIDETHSVTVQVFVDPFPRQSKTFCAEDYPSRKDALVAAIQWREDTRQTLIEQRQQGNLRTDLANYPLADLNEAYLKDPAVVVLAYHRELKRNLEWWDGQCGRCKVLDFGVQQGRAAREALLPGRAAGTVNRHIAAQRRAWNWGREAGLVPSNRLWPPGLALAEPRERVRYLSDEELPALLKVAKAHSVLMYAAIDQWAQRIELFEQMASRAYGPNVPGAQARTLSELKRLVLEINEVRTASAKEQRALEGIDAYGRDARQRLGFAVDALGLDASKARDELRAAGAELEEPAEATRRAAKAYADTQRELIAWEGRSGQVEPYKQLAEAHRTSADAVDAWLIERKRERDAQTALESKERGVSDLEYQIAELRSALAKHEAGIDRDRDAAQKRAVELSARLEGIEQRLLQLAAAFCAPLRMRPELGPLFQRLEASQASP